jgi:hypothetical protein
MKALTSLLAVIAILAVTASCDRPVGDDSARTRQILITRKYLTDQFKLIEDGTKKADSAWTRSGKLGEMKKLFWTAQEVKPPPETDNGAVVRFQQYLKEGIEFFDTADGEWTILRDFVGGGVAGFLDASGGMGVALTALFAAKGTEMANDESEKREFMQSEAELHRYIIDKGYFPAPK